jgi:hypothetical protein
MNEPRCIAISALAELDFSQMRMTNTQAEAEKMAIEYGQNEYYLFPPNHTFYVKVTK